MKKVGFLIFITAIIIGVSLANIFSFRESTEKFYNFSINNSVSGSGNTVVEKRHIPDFSSINVGGVFEVEASAGREFSIEVQADDNLLTLIKTEVRGSTLHLETETRISTKNPIRVLITAPDIENLDISGASKVSLNNINNEVLIIDASGASKVKVAGESTNLTIDVSGASNVAAENLKAENVSVDASGASSVEIFAENELKADASGASSVIYTGNPENLIKRTSGASTVRQK